MPDADCSEGKMKLEPASFFLRRNKTAPAKLLTNREGGTEGELPGGGGGLKSGDKSLYFPRTFSTTGVDISCSI